MRVTTRAALTTTKIATTAVIATAISSTDLYHNLGFFLSIAHADVSWSAVDKRTSLKASIPCTYSHVLIDAETHFKKFCKFGKLWIRSHDSKSRERQESLLSDNSDSHRRSPRQPSFILIGCDASGSFRPAQITVKSPDLSAYQIKLIKSDQIGLSRQPNMGNVQNFLKTRFRINTNMAVSYQQRELREPVTAR